MFSGRHVVLLASAEEFFMSNIRQLVVEVMLAKIDYNCLASVGGYKKRLFLNYCSKILIYIGSFIYLFIYYYETAYGAEGFFFCGSPDVCAKSLVTPGSLLSTFYSIL